MTNYTAFDDNFTVLRELEKLKKQVKILQETVDNLPGGEQLAGRVTALETQVATLEQEIAGVKPEEINQRFAEIQTSITNIQNDLNDIDRSITELQTATRANETAISSLQTGKQDKLTFDTTPTEGSVNPVTSDGIAKAIAAGGGGGSAEGKQDQLYALDPDGVTKHNILSQVDEEPMLSGIYRLITSAAVYAAINTMDKEKQDRLLGKAAGELITEVSDLFNADAGLIPGTAEAIPTSDAVNQLYNAVKTLVEGKQSKLTFDVTPTENSTNPVTSDGIAKAIAAGGGTITLDDSVTETSQNGVKSSGIYAAIEAARTALEGSLNTTNATVSLQGTEIAALKQQTEELETKATSAQGQIDAILVSIGSLGDDLEGKQAKLTFDTTPTENSTNPVTSDGIAKAIAAGGGGGSSFPRTYGDLIYSQPLSKQSIKVPVSKIISSIDKSKFTKFSRTFVKARVYFFDKDGSFLYGKEEIIGTLNMNLSTNLINSSGNLFTSPVTLKAMNENRPLLFVPTDYSNGFGMLADPNTDAVLHYGEVTISTTAAAGEDHITIEGSSSVVHVGTTSTNTYISSAPVAGALPTCCAFVDFINMVTQ